MSGRMNYAEVDARAWTTLLAGLHGCPVCGNAVSNRLMHVDTCPAPQPVKNFFDYTGKPDPVKGGVIPKEFGTYAGPLSPPFVAKEPFKATLDGEPVHVSEPIDVPALWKLRARGILADLQAYEREHPLECNICLGGVLTQLQERLA